MQRDLVAYYWDIVDAIDAIASFCDGLSYEQYSGSLLVQSAVERKFEIIGEAMRQMEQLFPGSLHGVPDSNRAKALRNRLAHGYFDIEQKILWDAIREDLPPLRTQLKSLMPEIG